MLTFNKIEDMDKVAGFVKNLVKDIERNDFRLVSYTVGTIEYDKFITSLLVVLSDYISYDDLSDEYDVLDRQAINISEFVALGVNEIITINIDEFKDKLYGIISVILGIKHNKFKTSRLLLGSNILTNLDLIKNDLSYFNSIKIILD